LLLANGRRSPAPAQNFHLIDNAHAGRTRAEEIEKLAEKAKSKHPDQADQLRARAAWYRTKADRLYRQRASLVLREEWRRITVWIQIQKEKNAGKYPTFHSYSICSGETYVVLEILLKFLDTEIEELAYVVHENSISVIAIDSRAVIDTIRRNQEECAPCVIVISSDCSRAYVAAIQRYYNTSSISVIDTDINRVITTIPVHGHSRGIAITPDGTRVYAALDVGDHTVIVVIATDSYKVITAIRMIIQGVPEGIVVAPNGKKVYVLIEEHHSSYSLGGYCLNGGVVSIITTDSHEVTDYIALMKGSEPTKIAITSDGAKVYVAHRWSTIISVIDTNSRQVTTIIRVKDSFNEIAITPNGARAYVMIDKHKVAVIDTNSNTVVDIIRREENEEGRAHEYNCYGIVAITRDGTQAYMTDSCSGNVFIYSLSNHKLIDTIKMSMPNYAIAIG
jgi:YVTN family beta-propeller protein